MSESTITATSRFGGTRRCSYVAPVGFGNSSVDLLGATFAYDYVSYNGVSPPAYPGIQTFNGIKYTGAPVAPQGVPNDYAASIAAGESHGWFGFPAFVSGSAQSLVYTCTFDFGPAPFFVCEMAIKQQGGTDANLTLLGSDDNSIWSDLGLAIVGSTSGIVTYSLDPSLAARRYWQLHLTRSVPGGLSYVAEVDLICFMLWGGPGGKSFLRGHVARGTDAL